MNERTHFFIKIYLSHFIWKGWCSLCVRGELETETDCYILNQSSSDHSSTSSSFCWATQPWVLRAYTLCLELVLTPWVSYHQLRLQLKLSAPSNWLKPSVAPGYIIVWHPPASCGCTHLHQIQPRPQVKVIFQHPRPDAPVSSAYLHRCISWLTAWSRVNMQHWNSVTKWICSNLK